MAYLHRTGLAGIYRPLCISSAPDRDETTRPMLPAILARHLDREADAELSQGHHAAAERLAWRAAELRGLA